MTTKPNSKTLSLQDFMKTPPSKSLITQNKYSPLQDFPTLSYSQAAKTPATPKTSKPTTSTSNPKASGYITKDPYTHIELTRYREIPNYSDLLEYIQQIFSDKQYWHSAEPHKDIQFYQLILLDSKSIEIHHTYDPNDSSKIQYSKAIILSIIYRLQWKDFAKGEFKKFSVPYDPPYYSYQDYQDAWFHAFLHRPFNHSWFFVFHKSFNPTYATTPIWWCDWWMYYGSSTSIFQEDTLKAFSLFSQKMENIPEYGRIIQFHAMLKVPWIFCWNFQVHQHYTQPAPMSLIRTYKIKWWNTFKVTTQQVLEFFQEQRLISRTPKKEETKSKQQENSSKALQLTTQDIDMHEYQEFLLFKKMKEKAKSKTSSEGSSSDPLGGPFAQDPYWGTHNFL